MRALVAERYGTPDQLIFRDVARPRPGEGEVLVQVAAAAVNPWDLGLISGDEQDLWPLQFPYVVGMDCSGTVAEIGTGVTRYAPGDRVFGMFRDHPGTIAQFALFPERSTLVAIKPPELSFEQAAALPEAGLTAAVLLRACAPRPGETIAVIGATGGIGMVFVPLAAAHGATIVATAPPNDESYVRRLGATATVDYTQVDTIAEIRRRYPRGVDAVVDLVHSGEDLLRTATVVAHHGRLLATLDGPDSESYGRDDLMVYYAEVNPEAGDLEYVGRRAADGTIPVEIKLYPFSQGAGALIDLATKHTRGKLVVGVD